MTTWTGTAPTLVAGDTSALVTKFNDLRDAVKAVSEAWTSYTPTWTASTANPTLGDGTLIGAYRQVTKAVEFRILLTIGSTSAAGTGNWIFSLPTAAHAAYAINMPLGYGLAVDASAPAYSPLVGGIVTASSIFLVSAAGTPLGPGAPYAWATGDTVGITGSYEAA